MTDRPEQLFEDSTDTPRVWEINLQELDALAAVLAEDGTRARRIIKEMPRKDRAIFAFWLVELSNIIDEIQLGDRL